jgi:hypothetical protein
MKSIIRLLLISLSIVWMHSLPADISALSLQQAHEIKAYVQTAKKLGYTDAQILSEFENAAQLLDQNNGVLALSLKYDERVVWSAIGVLSVATVIATIWLVHYFLQGDQTQSPPGQSNQQKNQPPGPQPGILPGEVRGVVEEDDR